MQSLTFTLPDAVVDALTERVLKALAERDERRRWAVGIAGLAEYLGCDERYAVGLRAKGLPGNRVGKRVVFDLREVDAWLERGGSA
jgi:hypothetical protein